MNINPLPQSSSQPFFCDHALEVRAATEGAGQVVFGYAAVFNQRSRTLYTPNGHPFIEQIAPGSFDSCDMDDCQVRFNHAVPLANYPNFRFGVDVRGLWYEYDHDPSDPNHMSAIRNIQRRDARGSSFMFLEPLQSDFEVHYEGKVPVRTIKRITKMLDVGPVLMPAYRMTTAFARGLDCQPVEPDPLPLSDVESVALALLESRRLSLLRILR